MAKKPQRPPTEELLEYADSRGVALKVNREKGIIHGVKILGRISKNGREYTPEALRRASGLYEGIRVNVDHAGSPTDRRSYKDRIGALEQIQVRDDGLYGDLRFNPKHALAEQLLWDAENSPQNVGMSHDARGRTSRVGGKTIVEEIEAVKSVDLVADPATTAGLFESVTTTEDNEMELKTLTLAELREGRDDLVKAILAEADDAKKVTALEAEIKTIREDRDALKATEAKRLLADAIAAELKEAKLDPSDEKVCSEIFMEALKAQPDAAKRKSLIEDRVALAGTAKVVNPPQAALPLREAVAGGSVPLTERVNAWTR
jgi:hypothetical protein